MEAGAHIRHAEVFFASFPPELLCHCPYLVSHGTRQLRNSPDLTILGNDKSNSGERHNCCPSMTSAANQVAPLVVL